MPRRREIPLNHTFKKLIAEIWRNNPKEWKQYHQIRNLLQQHPTLKDISERTLFRYLNLLVKEGFLEKRVELNHSTFYRPTKASIPAIFGALSFWWAMGYKAESTKILRVNGRTILEMPPENKMSLFGLMSRIFARAIYGFSKYLETGNIEWYEYTKSPLLINPFILAFFGWEQYIIRVEHGIKTTQPVLHIIEDLKEASASLEQVAELKKRTQKIFPKEWKYLEALEKAVAEKMGC